MLKRIDAFCESCDSEFNIELVDHEAIAKYCPVCGAELDQSEIVVIDDDFMHEDWED